MTALAVASSKTIRVAFSSMFGHDFFIIAAIIVSLFTKTKFSFCQAVPKQQSCWNKGAIYLREMLRGFSSDEVMDIREIC